MVSLLLLLSKLVAGGVVLVATLDSQPHNGAVVDDSLICQVEEKGATKKKKTKHLSQPWVFGSDTSLKQYAYPLKAC